MFNKSARKIPTHYKERGPTRHKNRGSTESVEAPWVPTAKWLPHDTSDFAAWGIASERAKREFDEVWKNLRQRMGDESLRRSADKARDLWLYTLAYVYPVGFWEGMADLYAGRAENLEIYISFLEADTRFHRSGYAKSDVIRGVKRLHLSAQQQKRLQDVVLRVVDKGFRREFRDYCRLARYVQSPGFLQDVEVRLSSPDPNRALRAKWVLDACVKT